MKLFSRIHRDCFARFLLKSLKGISSIATFVGLLLVACTLGTGNRSEMQFHYVAYSQYLSRSQDLVSTAEMFEDLFFDYMYEMGEFVGNFTDVEEFG